MNIFRSCVLRAFALFLPMVPMAQAGSVTDLMAAEPGGRGASRTLSHWLPEEQNLVVLVDAGSARSQALLEGLLRNGMADLPITIVIVDADRSSRAGALALDRFMAARVLVSDRGSYRAQLATAPMPAVFGIDGEGRIAWRRSGPIRHPHGLIRQALEWISP